MKNFLLLMLLAAILLAGCTAKKDMVVTCTADGALDSLALITLRDHASVQGSLLGTRYTSLEELKSVIQIIYFNHNEPNDSIIHKNDRVVINHCSGGKEVTAVLSAGTSQNDISKAQIGGVWDQLRFIVKSPYCVASRKDLEKVFLLARLKPDLFGEGDVAFFDLARATVLHINTPQLAFGNARDSTEKGYLNTFNHIAAQAFITSCFSEELADFVADAHERANHAELITGKFSDKQLHDLAEGPLDNYVDVVNNEWGQELGKQLKEKYHISRQTLWTPELLSNYLNDMQLYYSWAMQIGFRPFKPQDEQMIKFAKKMNAVLNGSGSYTKFG